MSLSARTQQERVLARLQSGQHVTLEALEESLDDTASELDVRIIIETLRARGELIIETSEGFKVCANIQEFAHFMNTVIMPGLGRAVGVANVMLDAANAKFGTALPLLELRRSEPPTRGPAFVREAA